MSLLFLEEMRAVDLRIRLVSHLSFTSIHPSICQACSASIRCHCLWRLATNGQGSSDVMVSKGMGRALEGAERGFLVSGVQPKPKEWREVGLVPQVGGISLGGSMWKMAAEGG